MVGGLTRGPHVSGARVQPGVGWWGLYGLAITSFGGPLALSALYAPQLVADVAGSAGLVTAASVVMFAVPLVVWLGYARKVSGAAGLAGFVEAAVGRPLALVQAAVWTVSYLLYLLYTSAYVVYDVLPSAITLPAGSKPLLAVALPVAVVVVLLAPQRIAWLTITAIAVGQLVLAALLAVVAVAHATSLAAASGSAPPATVVRDGAGVALLYVCGSLPVFFGADLTNPTVRIPRAMVAGYAVAALAVVVTVTPMAAEPAFLRAPIPGASLAEVEWGRPVGVAIGVGVACSVLGVMLVEYLAVVRLGQAVTGWPAGRLTAGIAVAVVLAGPVSLVDPEQFYTDLLRPSLIALWVAQVIPVAVFPWFAARHGTLRAGHLLLATTATAFMIYGLVATLRV